MSISELSHGIIFSVVHFANCTVKYDKKAPILFFTNQKMLLFSGRLEKRQKDKEQVLAFCSGKSDLKPSQLPPLEISEFHVFEDFRTLKYM